MQRINFSVVKISGEEENFPAAELNYQQPTVKGWQSPKFCSYPQLIVVRLEARARIYKFELLSHEYLISKNIEIFVGDVPKGMPEVPQNVVWEKQGEIALSENALSKYTARELRSVLLDVVAKFLKLILHQNHINRLNLCNQVGLIAINVIGEIILEGGSKKAKYVADQDISSIRLESIFPVDELAFSMYVDPEVGEILRSLQKKKLKAVADDRFVYAKKLKYAMLELRRLGEKLGKLEIEKQLAIEAEDYDKAHVKKEQIETLRMKDYKRLRLTELMELEGNPDEEIKQDMSPQKAAPEEMHLPLISNYVNSEDILPTVKKGGKSQPSVFAGEDVQPTDVIAGVMTEKDKRDASLPIEVFGLALVQKMYSKSYSQREDTLKEILSFLEKYERKGKTHMPGDVIKATTFLIQKALRDKVHSIYSTALEVLKFCFGTFVPNQSVPKVDSTFLADKTMPDIISKLGDTAPRVKNTTVDYIMSIANYPEVVSLQVVPQYCLGPVQHDLNTRLVQAKCELAENLVRKHPLWRKEVLPLNKVLLFLVDALHHPSAAVKHVAERVIIFLYEHEGQVVKTFLPRPSEVPKRNIMYRRIFRTFEKIDKQRRMNRKTFNDKKGKQFQNEKKTAKKDEGKLIKPNDEINLNKTCIFCDERNEDFTPKGLDIHYDRYCPMLIHCSNCKQVVEIAGLTEHLLEECDYKEQYKQCPICLEAVPLLNYEDHTRVRSCMMAKGNDEDNHCPLCHQNIASGEQGWRNHLMSNNGCPYNSRRKGAEKRRKSILFKKLGGAIKNS